MARKIELLVVTTPDKPTRYYADGKRITDGLFCYYEGAALSLDTFHSKCKELPGGRFKRWNYKTATLSDADLGAYREPNHE